MLLFVTIAVALFILGGSESAGVISKHDVDPAEIDYQNATTVLLKNVKIHEIPKNYFQDLGLDLSLLRITKSQLDRIDEQAFDGLDHLNLLELSEDGIIRLEPKTFLRLRGLELLQLKSNKLRKVSLELHNVQEIVLSRNQIEELQEDFIRGGSVTFIDLRYNKLKTLQHSMKSLVKLATIHIGNNELVRVNPVVFADNDNLVRVYASGNRLTSTEGFRLKQLKSLDLSSNQITRLENDSFAGMVFLDDLQLKSNGISDLDHGFDPVTNLKYLDLSDNKITFVHPDSFKNNQYLSKLSLSKNKIRTLQPFSKKMHHLTVLDLSRNELQAINSDFFKPLDKLEILDLSFNKLTKIGALLRPLTNLVTLDMSNNGLKFDKNELCSLSKLSHLNLSSNNLEIGLSQFDNNKHLSHLDLSRNNITNFCDTDLRLDYLSAIDLSHNQIKDLNCFKNNNLLVYSLIDIRQNPFTCDSNFDDVIQHFVLMHSNPNGMQTYNVKDHSVTRSLSTTLEVWNAVKRELCPNGLDININMVLNGLQSEEEEEHKNKEEPDYPDTFSDTYWDNDYYSDISKNEDEEYSTESTVKDVELDIEVKLKADDPPILPDELHTGGAQSEKDSWNQINKAQNMEKEYDDQRPIVIRLGKGQSSLFTISLIFIGIGVLLVLANIAIIMFIRMKGWKKDFRGVQKYTHLENKVYKETTMPNSADDNYTLNCARMFQNFGFRSGEEDAESVKKMIADNGIKTEV